jgi:hypothetical protein
MRACPCQGPKYELGSTLRVQEPVVAPSSPGISGFDTSRSKGSKSMSMTSCSFMVCVCLCVLFLFTQYV